MNNHHLKAYIFFLILSLLLIGVLVYLYSPGAGNLRSDALASGEVTMSGEVISGEEGPTLSAEVSADATSSRRIRLTNMLLRYQSQLGEIDSTQMDDEKKMEKEQLQIKIDNLTTMIKELSE